MTDINDLILKAIETMRTENNAAHKTLNGRLRKVEVWRGWITGGLAVLCSGVIIVFLKVFLGGQ